MTHVDLCIVGCGGHARSVADVALDSGMATLIFVDPRARDGEEILGYTVATPAQFLASGVRARHHIIALGDNAKREVEYGSFGNSEVGLVSVIARDARIGRGVLIGEGVFVGFGAHLGPSARIGDDVIVNTRAVIEHEVSVGSHTHVAVCAVLLGRSRIGQRGTVGAGAIVLDGVDICDDVTIGAGAVVTRNIEVAGTYAGVPARRLHD
jgi:sugar O-acyltransferase (sialic acid O-acetyltransferase NeuD family)